MGTSDRSFAWAQCRRSARESRAATGAAIHRIGGSAGGWSSNTTRAAASGRSGSRARRRNYWRRPDWNFAPRGASGACRRVAYRTWSSGGLRSLLGPDLMPEREVKIINKLGIHARPAAELVKTAGKFKSNITIVRDDLEVNAKSIMGVMMLAAECGATVVLRALGDDAQEAIDALAAVIANKFGES